MNGVIDAVEIDFHHFVPLALGDFFDGRVFLVPDAGVGDEDVDSAEAVFGEFDQFFIVERRG